MIKTIALAICLIVTLSSTSIAGKYQDVIIDQAKKYDHVRELTNKNDGVDIERWLKNVGLGKGNPYCQSFVYSMCFEVQPTMKGTMPFKTGRVSNNYYLAKKDPVHFKFITLNQVRLGIYKLEKGDMIVWSSSPDGTIDFSGHTGYVLQQISENVFMTLEANTQPSEAGNQREGGGVYYRQRMLKSYWNFKLVGFIRIIK